METLGLAGHPPGPLLEEKASLEKVKHHLKSFLNLVTHIHSSGKGVIAAV